MVGRRRRRLPSSLCLFIECFRETGGDSCADEKKEEKLLTRGRFASSRAVRFRDGPRVVVEDNLTAELLLLLLWEVEGAAAIERRSGGGGACGGVTRIAAAFRRWRAA